MNPIAPMALRSLQMSLDGFTQAIRDAQTVDDLLGVQAEIEVAIAQLEQVEQFAWLKAGALCDPVEVWQ